jgi:hypothetical protein
MFSDGKVDRPTAVVRDNYEDEQELEQSGRNHKEVSSDDILIDGRPSGRRLFHLQYILDYGGSGLVV